MVSPDNILMYLLPKQEVQVKEIFAQPTESGFPRWNQKPHITVTFTPAMRPAVIQRAAEVLPPLMPAEFRRMGTVVFGTKSRQTIAWLLEASDELKEAAREVSRLNPDGRDSRWIPHLAMDPRIPHDIVPDYVRALDEIIDPHFKTLSAPRATFWNSKAQELAEFQGNSSACVLLFFNDCVPLFRKNCGFREQ